MKIEIRAWIDGREIQLAPYWQRVIGEAFAIVPRKKRPRPKSRR